MFFCVAIVGSVLFVMALLGVLIACGAKQIATKVQRADLENGGR